MLKLTCAIMMLVKKIQIVKTAANCYLYKKDTKRDESCEEHKGDAEYPKWKQVVS